MNPHKMKGDTSVERIWRPGTLGRLLGRDWELGFTGDTLRLRMGAATQTADVAQLSQAAARRGLLSSTATLELHGRTIALAGLRHGDAAAMVFALNSAAGEVRQYLLAARVVAWAQELQAAVPAEFAARGWLGRDFRNHWRQARPDGDLSLVLVNGSLARNLGATTAKVRATVELWHADLSLHFAELNEARLRSEEVEAREFFAVVERSPLTNQQVRAVVCLDERVQVIASAGSGKTSTMVAKAGYVLHRRMVPAEKILLLAFNADAAAELQQRIRDRLLPLGLPAEQVQAKTFHSFGLEIIGQATGRKPSLAPWVSDGRDLARLGTLVEKLRRDDPHFRGQWDLYRLVLSRGAADYGGQQAAAGVEELRTLQGETVRSQGERIIADWLFYNGVGYVYERPYEHQTVDATHVQYRPDFYYPGIDAYHEHFALDRHGQAPPEFTGYLDGVKWKRAVHGKHGTTLLETTTAQLWDGELLEHLARALTERGIVLDPNPDRRGRGPEPVRNEQLVRTFRTFLIHAKSNSLDAGALRERLGGWAGSPWMLRHSVFLNLFEAIRDAWEKDLELAGVIDFEDMLGLAADHLEAGRWDTGHELVMVDEFQDASHARARLAGAVVDKPGRMLFAVGDDWQGINGFAGADLSVMTDFARWFGEAQTLRMERTFRSPQSICSVAGAFVQKNPVQLRKEVVSAATDSSPSIVAASLAGEHGY